MFIFWGTKYVAKGERRTRIAPCSHCRRVAQLESFDGARWFHLYGLGIVRTAKLHVIDQCPACRRLRGVKPDEWDQMASQSLAHTRSEAASELDRPGVALARLAAESMFGSLEEAGRIAESLAQRFPDDADVRSALLTWHRERGDVVSARAFLPESPTDEQLRTLAAAALVTRRFDQTAELLPQLKAVTPGDFQNGFRAMHALSSVQPKSAAKLAQFLFERFGKLATSNGALIRTARKLEAELKLTLAPKGAKPFPNWIIPIAVVGLLGLVVVGLNEYQKRHQTLVVVNPLKISATVALGSGRLHVPPGARIAVDLPEGSYSARVMLENGVRRTVELHIENSLVSRFRTRVFVAPVLGAGAFYVEDVKYGGAPNASSSEPPELLGGLEFFEVDGVDDLFHEPPESISNNSGSSTRRVLNVMIERPSKLIREVEEDVGRFPQFDARRYAEGLITGGVADADLLDAYREYCIRNGCQDEARAFLEGAKNGPSPRPR